MPDPLGRIAIVGASGAVGREALDILAASGVSPTEVTALGSERSAGSAAPFGRHDLRIHLLDAFDPAGIDVALFCANADTARRHVPRFVDAGAFVVDNSSAFRMDPATPLVIPEFNTDWLDATPTPRLVANPNCSTIILLTALQPIRERFGIDDVVVATYQAVSGAGAAAIQELEAQCAGLDSEPRVFPHPCAFNVFPHESPVDPDTGLNVEEAKIVAESRRILGDPSLSITPTCVRVPVIRSHSQAITVSLARPASRAAVEHALRAAPGVRLCGHGDDPTPLRATGLDDIIVGRVRVDPGSGGRRLSLWVCGDQLRKGAALNAVQIARRLVARASRRALADAALCIP